jgi:hypothetical protein
MATQRQRKGARNVVQAALDRSTDEQLGLRPPAEPKCLAMPASPYGQWP